MADTFLNSARTSMATSNVQQNLNQVSGQGNISNNVNESIGVNQPTQPNQTQNSQVNPITIPLQIQPQIAPIAQPNQNLQVENQQQQTYNAPTPQPYNNTNTNNVVDFDQIYKNYNSMSGRNNQNTQSGIKKTSYNTTIVTPTASNLNSVQGQYQSAYSDTINGVISTMLTQIDQLRMGEFGYDPTQDMALKMASEYAANSTLQSLAGSGVLNSSATAERVARIVSELIPQYEEKAYNRQVQYLSQLADTAQLVMNFDNQQFNYWKDAKDREFKEKEFDFEKKQKELDNAWKRVDELGYVDNNASTILGVKVGTLSGAAREAKEQREFELAKMREQEQIEHANNVALAKLKSDLDLQTSKVMAAYNNQLERERLQYQNTLNMQYANYENNLKRENMRYQNELNKEAANYENSLKQNNMKYEYELSKQYGTTSSKSSSNLSTYDDIIKNRFAEYDDFTKQYVVPDAETYAQLGNYLDNLYASGQINESEFLQLSAKYSKYTGQTYGLNGTSSNSNIAASIYPSLYSILGTVEKMSSKK